MKKKSAGKTTIEKLARMSQREFVAIRGEMGEMREDTHIIKEDVRILRNDVEAGFNAVSETMKVIIQKLNSIQQDVIELHDFRARIERLEKKVGLLR